MRLFFDFLHAQHHVCYWLCRYHLIPAVPTIPESGLVFLCYEGLPYQMSFRLRQSSHTLFQLRTRTLRRTLIAVGELNVVKMPSCISMNIGDLAPSLPIPGLAPADLWPTYRWPTIALAKPASLQQAMLQLLALVRLIYTHMSSSSFLVKSFPLCSATPTVRLHLTG